MSEAPRCRHQPQSTAQGAPIQQESDLHILEQDWDKVKVQTLWSLESCYMSPNAAQPESHTSTITSVSIPESLTQPPPDNTCSSEHVPSKQLSPTAVTATAEQPSNSDHESNNVDAVATKTMEIPHTPPFRNTPSTPPPPHTHIRNKSSSSSKCFSILYFNCRSLVRKFDDLILCCEINSPDFICLVETWLEDNITDNDILIPNYVCVRHDRNRHGGGILLYIKSCFQYKILVKGPSNLELLFVSINQGLTIGVFDRPLSSPSIVMDTLFNILISFDIHVFLTLFS